MYGLISKKLIPMIIDVLPKFYIVKNKIWINVKLAVMDIPLLREDMDVVLMELLYKED
jgi:hypothetical protein